MEHNLCGKLLFRQLLGTNTAGAMTCAFSRSDLRRMFHSCLWVCRFHSVAYRVTVFFRNIISSFSVGHNIKMLQCGKALVWSCLVEIRTQFGPQWKQILHFKRILLRKEAENDEFPLWAKINTTLAPGCGNHVCRVLLVYVSWIVHKTLYYNPNVTCSRQKSHATPLHASCELVTHKHTD